MSVLIADIDLSDVPIAALRDSTRNELEIALNKLKVIPTDEGNIPRFEFLTHPVDFSNFVQSLSSQICFCFVLKRLARNSSLEWGELSFINSI